GNNIVEVYTKITEIAREMRENPHPVLIEFKTFRMRGHEEASGTKYVPEELMTEWAAKDPIENFKMFLLEKGILTGEEDARFKEDLKIEIDKNWKQANLEEPIISDESNELRDVYQGFIYEDIAENNSV